ncbi:MAG: histidinol-phosphate transaminase [Burkholderiaceae bacterium]
MSLPIRPAVLASPDYPFVAVDALIKLDQNESTQDLPDELKALICDQLRFVPWNRYPDLNSESICKVISTYEGWPAESVVVTTGSNVLIALLTQLAGTGQQVVTAKPNFALYALGARLFDANLTEVPLTPNLALDLPQLAEVIRSRRAGGPSEGRGVLYLPQPHAPTGSVVDAESLRSLVREAPDWLVVIDEAYHQFADTDCRPIAKEFDNVVLLRTFSKAWGLAGLRLGYALTSPAVASNLRKLVPPFATSVMQTIAISTVLTHASYLTERIKLVIAERERMLKALANHPRWQAYPSHANFILIRTPNAEDAFRHLLSKGILVRRQDSYFGLKGCIRVTVGQPAENAAFLQAALTA